MKAERHHIVIGLNSDGVPLRLGEEIKNVEKLVVELISLCNEASSNRMYWNLYGLIRDRYYTENQLKKKVKQLSFRKEVRNYWDKLMDILKANALDVGVATKNSMFIQYCVKSLYKMEDTAGPVEQDSNKLVVNLPEGASPRGLLAYNEMRKYEDDVVGDEDKQRAFA